jgi:hypothetical protein
LKSISLSQWVQFASLSFRRRASHHVSRFAVLFGAVLIVYMSIVALYYPLATQARQKELESLGVQVDGLLLTQRKVDKQRVEYEAVLERISEPPLSMDAWRIAGAVWKAGGRLTGFEFTDGQVTVRGRAKNATDLLRILSTSPGVEAAKFDSPVRQEGEEQEFSINLRLVPVK